MNLNMNLFILSGKLTKDPYYQVRDRKNGEGQYSQACYTVVNAQRNRDGSTADSFYDIDVFGENAKAAKEYLHQGSQVTLRGILKSSPYTSRRGEVLNTLGLTVYEQESPDIPEKENDLRPPEAGNELPERAGNVANERYEYEEPDYFQ